MLWQDEAVTKQPAWCLCVGRLVSVFLSYLKVCAPWLLSVAHLPTSLLMHAHTHTHTHVHTHMYIS